MFEEFPVPGTVGDFIPKIFGLPHFEQPFSFCFLVVMYERGMQAGVLTP